MVRHEHLASEHLAADRTITREAMTAEFRARDYVTSFRSRKHEASFAIQDGVPGLVAN
ncbi:hypothetical protein [Pseudarthrobacter sp.]|uniref:hypothetical protein n=1 Tax=Pseudarthrobacter sp. TaxID=1934409 RepID=UPI002FC9DA41